MPEPQTMSHEEESILAGTVSHFREIARLNRFAENAAFAHDAERCAVCRPGLLPMDPFAVYLDVVTQSIKMRRPRLDQDLVDAINGDLALMGESFRTSLEAFESGEPDASACWRNWLRDALATGLGLLSIHSSSSLEFDLDEQEEKGFNGLILAKIRELMEYQKNNANIPATPPKA